jgi:hypothetical protein
VGSKSNLNCVLKEEKRPDIHPQRNQVMMQKETEVMHPQTKNCQGLATTLKLEESRKDFSA